MSSLLPCLSNTGNSVVLYISATISSTPKRFGEICLTDEEQAPSDGKRF